MKKITDDIRYIGVDDADINLFESQYNTPDGMCYNSYLLEDERLVVMDTSDARTMDEWKKNLAEALDGRKPDYLIVHHLEPDHASGIEEVAAMYPEMTIVCSARAAKMMPLYFDAPLNIKTVEDGEQLQIGQHTLTFIMAPMVHWPEVMMTYDDKSETLFSADGFGKFGTYDADADDWACEARRYYFNICGKYGSQVHSVLDKASGLKISRICPLHGPVLEGEKLAEALRLYGIWSSYGVETEGVFIAYASIHGNTAAAAKRFAEMLKEKGCPKVAITDLCRDDQAEAIEDAFRYGKIVLAASSYDATVFPPMHDFLYHLQIKAWQQKTVGIIENGSWAPTAARTMKKMLEEMKEITIVDPTVTIRGKMRATDEEALSKLADMFI